MAHKTSSIADHIEDLRKLIRKYKEVDVEDNIDWSPLHIAVTKNRKDLVEVLLNHPDTDLNGRNGNGYTSLMLTCDFLNQDLYIARDILNHGADPNIPDNEGVCPLHLACGCGNLELVELLLRHQANVNCQNSNGYTPLHWAIEIDSPELIAYLLAHNADANLTQAQGLNALMLAVQLKRNYVDLLISHTQNLDALTKDGWTALLFAIHTANLSVVRALIKGGASLTPGWCVYSPLELAAKSQHYDLFELIWRHSDMKKVSENRDFIRLFCEYCPLPRCYKHYELILNTHGADLHANAVPEFFYNIIECGPPNRVDFGAAQSQYLNVIGWLLDRNVQLLENNVHRIVAYFKQCPYTTVMWKMIFAKTTPDINENTVALAIMYKNYELALLLATYCLHLNPKKVIAGQHNVSERFMRTWLSLFTPTGQHRKIIMHRLRVFQRDSAKQLLNNTKQVKSLLELCRDTVRDAMQDSCNTTQDFLVALGKLEIPTYLKDVLRLRIPVNKYLLED